MDGISLKTYHVKIVSSVNSNNSTLNVIFSPSVVDIHWEPSSLNRGGNFSKMIPVNKIIAINI